MAIYRFHTPSVRLTPPAILTRFHGPQETSSRAIWAQLVDFETWNRWMPGVDVVERQDAGAPGRGSTLHLKGKVGRRECQICHWEPNRRLDLVFNANNKRIGYSITLENSEQDEYTEIRLEMEFEFSGLGSLLRFVSVQVEKRRAHRFLERFAEHMRLFST